MFRSLIFFLVGAVSPPDRKENRYRATQDYLYKPAIGMYLYINETRYNSLYPVHREHSEAKMLALYFYF